MLPANKFPNESYLIREVEASFSGREKLIRHYYLNVSQLKIVWETPYFLLCKTYGDDRTLTLYKKSWILGRRYLDIREKKNVTALSSLFSQLEQRYLISSVN